MTLARRSLAAAVGLGADALLGEPPLDPHPVGAFGSAMGRVERALYGDHVVHGAAYAAIGVAAGATAGAAVRSTALATYLAVAGRALAEAATAVAEPLVAGDLATARLRLPALVGRDAESLDDAGIARAVIESVAENTTDAVVAPVLWAVVAGAPGTLAYRAVNTMDAMVGYRSPRHLHFGRASARLDDVANWVPARATALLVAAARPGRAGAIAGAVRRDAPAHPSPNSGVAEAAFAAALGIRLGGTNTYEGRVDERPVLGDGRSATPADIAAAVELAGDIHHRLGVALVSVGAASLVRHMVTRPRRGR